MLLKKVYDQDLKSISDQRMLSDNVIHVIQQMIAEQNNVKSGLQDPILGQTLRFAIYRTTPFVQVLHDDGCHWVSIIRLTAKLGK